MIVLIKGVGVENLHMLSSEQTNFDYYLATQDTVQTSSGWKAKAKAIKACSLVSEVLIERVADPCSAEVDAYELVGIDLCLAIRS